MGMVQIGFVKQDGTIEWQDVYLRAPQGEAATLVEGVSTPTWDGIDFFAEREACGADTPVVTEAKE